MRKMISNRTMMILSIFLSVIVAGSVGVPARADDQKPGKKIVYIVGPITQTPDKNGKNPPPKK
jgi:hypothetical protein